MAAVQMLSLALLVIVATVVVFVREPRRQIFPYMLYGLLLTVFLALVQAPDVALSELAVGSVAIPFAVLATLVRIAHGRKP